MNDDAQGRTRLLAARPAHANSFAGSRRRWTLAAARALMWCDAPSGQAARAWRAGPAVAGLFEDFYRQQIREVAALVSALTGDWVVAEEVAQDALVQAHVRWRGVQSRPRPELGSAGSP